MDGLVQSAALTSAIALFVAMAPAATRPEFARSQEAKGKETRRDPGPRSSVGGIAGFDSLSRVRFAAAPDVVHELKVTCSFPERMRWMLSAHVEGSLVRELQYVYGDAVYRIPTGSAASEVCQGEARTEILRQWDLRRALMLYPDGFEWKGGAAEKKADLGALGSLLARAPVEPGGRPGVLEFVDAAGRSTGAFRAITWKESAGRTWPSTFEFWRGEERVWSETVESVDTSARFVESYFLPPDLREGSTTRSIAASVRTLEIPDTCVLRTAIAGGTSWEVALRDLARLRTARAKRLEGTGLELERVATFEISDQGEPIASILRLTAVPAEPPEGFVKEHGRKGLASAVEGLVRADGTRIAELRRGLPKGAVAGRPYLRFDLDETVDPRRVVLVLPFDPAH